MPKDTHVTDTLAEVLADTYALYLKTQNYHWNVTGSHFYPLHLMFESQYGALAEAVDTLAERIRALGAAAPGSFKAFLGLSSLKEAKTETLDGKKMVSNLLADHEAVAQRVKAALAVTQEAGDEATADMLIERIEAHEKFAWMLRSTRA